MSLRGSRQVLANTGHQRRMRADVGAQVTEEEQGVGKAEIADTVEVGGSVHPLELGAGRGARLEVAQRVLIDVAEAGQNGLDPLRALGVAASGVMLGKPRICRYQQHEHRVSMRPRRYGCSR